MQRASAIGVAILSLLLVGCATVNLESGAALEAEKLEMQFDGKGGWSEIEYHVSPDSVPAEVKQAMDELHPGGAFTGAERETHAGQLYYELTREVQGMEVEAMFKPDGTLFQEEIQVAENKVPAAIRTAARGAIEGASVTKWEEIRDKDRKVFEYHVKMAKGGKHYKVLVSLEGKLLAVYREIPAEVEVRSR